MYASRDPSAEMATRPDQGAPGAIASVESIARVDRTTCFAGAGRIQPQIAPAEISMTRTITAYNIVLSRRLCSLSRGVEVATDGVTDGLCGDIAGRLKRRREILDLGVRLHLELLSHEFPDKPGRTVPRRRGRRRRRARA